MRADDAFKLAIDNLLVYIGSKLKQLINHSFVTETLRSLDKMKAY